MRVTRKMIMEALMKEEAMSLLQVRSVCDRQYYNYFMKINSGLPGLVLVYTIETEDKGIIPVANDLKFIGIFNKNTKVFYNYELYFWGEDDRKVEGFMEVNHLESELIKDVNDAIISKIGYDESKIKEEISEKELRNISQRAKESAYRTFMKEVEFNKFSYAEYNPGSFKYSNSLYLHYLSNKEATVEKEANTFIQKNQQSIKWNILMNKSIQTELAILEKDEKLHLDREIYRILSDESRKTVNIDFLSNGEIKTFKINTRRDHIDRRFSSYSIEGSAKVKDEFDDFFPVKEYQYRRASFDDIIKISYGRKVLFERG